jgi:hypothetical protein
MTDILDFRYRPEVLPYDAICKAVVLRSDAGVTRVAFLEIDANLGPSVTNSWPDIAQQFMPHLPGERLEAVEWYEVYPYRFKYGRENVYRFHLGGARKWSFVQDAEMRQRIWSAFGCLVPA